jgi:hypothetical protein
VRDRTKTGLSASRNLPPTVPCYEWRVLKWQAAANMRSGIHAEGRGLIPAENQCALVSLPLALIQLRNSGLAKVALASSLKHRTSRILITTEVE